MPCYCGFCCHDTIIAATPQNLWQQKSSTTSSELELAFIVELQYSVLCAVKQIGNISTSCSYNFCFKKVCTVGRSHFVLDPHVIDTQMYFEKFTELRTLFDRWIFYFRRYSDMVIMLLLFANVRFEKHFYCSSAFLRNTAFWKTAIYPQTTMVKNSSVWYKSSFFAKCTDWTLKLFRRSQSISRNMFVSICKPSPWWSAWVN